MISLSMSSLLPPAGLGFFVQYRPPDRQSPAFSFLPRSPMKLRIVCLLGLVATLALLATALPGGGADRPPAADKKKLTKADVEKMMTSLSNWGRWGKKDQLGALNLITPQKRRQAAALVKEGITISLARPVI